MSLRYFLPIYLVVYVMVAFFWRSYVVRKRTGINPVVFARSDNAYDFIGRVFKLLFVAVVAVVVVYSFIPGAYQYLMPVPWLDQSRIRLLWLILLGASLVWTASAQSQIQYSYIE